MVQKLRVKQREDWEAAWMFVQTPAVREILQRVLVTLQAAKEAKKAKL